MRAVRENACVNVLTAEERALAKGRERERGEEEDRTENRRGQRAGEDREQERTESRRGRRREEGRKGEGDSREEERRGQRWRGAERNTALPTHGRWQCSQTVL